MRSILMTTLAVMMVFISGCYALQPRSSTAQPTPTVPADGTYVKHPANMKTHFTNTGYLLQQRI